MTRRRTLLSPRRLSGRAFSRSVIGLLCILAMTIAFPSSAQGSGGQDPKPAPNPPPPLPRLTSPEVRQDTLTAADETAGRNVNVSFTNNFIADRLPFDVPFNVTGTVEQTVRRLELSVYRVSSNVDLGNLINHLQTTVDCVGQQPPGRLVSRSTVAPGSTGQFSMFVNALDPQYYYAFCFVAATPIPTGEFEADARRILGSVLPGLVKQDDISLSVLNVVHGAMRDRIAQLGAGRPVRATIPPGNLFAEGTKPDVRFAALANELAVSYGNLVTPLENYRQSLTDLLGDFGAARSGPAKDVFTPELVAQLPTASRALPTPEIAVSADPKIDRAAYAFDGTIAVLEKAKATFPEGSQAVTDLNTIIVDLQEVAGDARQYFRFFDALHLAAGTFMSYVALEARVISVTLGSSVLGADLSRSAYVSLDAGVAYPWRLANMVFFAGANIYFRPINKAAPLRYKGSFLHRFALTVGITTTVRDESRRAEDLRNTPDNDETSNSLLLGGGLRVTPSMRLGGGVLVFRETDPNPLINQKSVTVTPYVSFTADVDVAQIFRAIF
jgi:hypothetical protein